MSGKGCDLGRAAVCDCGTPWTFLLPILRFVIAALPGLFAYLVFHSFFFIPFHGFETVVFETQPRSLIRVFVVRMKKLCILGYPNINTQAGLNLCLANISGGLFSDIAVLIMFLMNISGRISGDTKQKCLLY